MLLESQYHQFKEDLNVQKPKGGMAFVTDFERKDIRDMKALTMEAVQAKAEEKKPVALAAPPPANKLEEEKMLESDLPKFEDDWWWKDMYSIGKYESHLSQFSVSPVEFDAGQFIESLRQKFDRLCGFYILFNGLF